MTVKSVRATDYSTGTTYTYSDTSGSWQSIKSSGGTINSSGNGADSSAMASAPSVTEVSSGAPSPFGGTHRDTTSTFSTPSVWPWVPSATTLQTEVSQTSIPGLPSGWTISASGKVVPPSAAPVSELIPLFAFNFPSFFSKMITLVVYSFAHQHIPQQHELTPNRISPHPHPPPLPCPLLPRLHPHPRPRAVVVVLDNPSPPSSPSRNSISRVFQ